MSLPARRQVRTQPTVTLRVALRLLSGTDWQWLEPDISPLSLEELRSVWQVLGVELTTFYRHHYPARRPAAFWWFDATVPRRQVPEQDGGIWIDDVHQLVPGQSEDVANTFECSCAYLRRVHALTPAEQALVRSPRWRGCREETEGQDDDPWWSCGYTAQEVEAWLRAQAAM